MAEKTLVESQIGEVIELIKELDNAAYSPKLAVWYYFSEIEEWRFILAGPEFDKNLPKQEAIAYRVVAEAINKCNLNTLTVADIKLMKTDEPLTKTMGFLIRTDSKGFVKAHFSDTTINGIFLKEMVVLRSA